MFDYFVQFDIFLSVFYYGLEIFEKFWGKCLNHVVPVNKP